ncbi:hypothetical protein Tco_1540739 [Tanacetum coccineum]
MERVFIPPMAGLGLGLHGLSMGLELTSLSDTKVIHNDDGNPSRANIKQALGRLILTDSKEYTKMDMEVPGSSRLTRFIATCSYSTDQQSINLIPYEVLKLKNIKKDG